MAHDSKYGRVTVERKELLENEPVFVVRGTDVLAVGLIRNYARMCGAHGSPTAHVEALYARANEIQEWQDRNPECVKVPD